ncbi:ATP-binding protein [Alkalicella caledoniensis]|uniref:ATP-binding protein n=1 Tax=Alkalicella caledoniensis TaxID=2731377 RepID=A0A7G9W8N9_ALKCA|nr:IS21-like element helper ATPase IstB [Alkalicella caledoniensis]QNO13393.1 ATP-binding protein [Alkalicella caledoniensis]QNO15051.1 ATP-binding protein [Alkalicella caledoniensis]
MKSSIAEYCRLLRLGNHIVKHYEDIKAETHEEFLLKILEVEYECREVVKKNRAIKAATFDMLKTFETYEFKKVSIPKSTSIEDIKSGAFIDRKENLILYGGVGLGKTHLATSIGIEACNNGKKVKFYRTATLVNELIDAKENGSLTKLMRKLKKMDLIICDEWGYIPLDTDGAQLLFNVISECYEKRSIILTTNLEFSKWNNIFYNDRLTSAIVDRLVHYSHLLIFEGPSHRVENSILRNNQ